MPFINTTVNLFYNCKILLFLNLKTILISLPSNATHFVIVDFCPEFFSFISSLYFPISNLQIPSNFLCFFSIRGYHCYHCFVIIQGHFIFYILTSIEVSFKFHVIERAVCATTLIKPRMLAWANVFTIENTLSPVNLPTFLLQKKVIHITYLVMCSNRPNNRK